jgi:hypothetical protein
VPVQTSQRTKGTIRFPRSIAQSSLLLFEIRVTLPGFSVQTLEVGPSRRTGSSAGLVNVKVRFDFLGETAAPPPTRGRPPTGTLPPPSPPAPLPPPTPPQPPDSIGAAPAENHAVVKVFYATDRARMAADPVSYGGGRNPSGTLHLGRFDVSVPRDHRMGSVERPTVLTLWREDPNKHFIIVNRVQQTYEIFYDEVSALVRASVRKEAFVFIHGYNVTFESAIYRTAQFAYDLGFDGAPILYSWPSEGTEVGYPVDQNNNEWTVEHLRWFLEDVSARSGAEMIHLVAHSMGNRALTYALRQIATARGAASRLVSVPCLLERTTLSEEAS